MLSRARLSVFHVGSDAGLAGRYCESYSTQLATWPERGKQLLAFWDSEGVVVYQAFNKSIAQYAAEKQTFKGCPGYSYTRMTWIKTNFMWMMYRCGWGVKDVDQERVLALKISHEGMKAILQEATRKGGSANSTVRLQWDPDHAPSGESLPRLAIQLGLKGEAAQKFLESHIVRIEDITDTLVRPQWSLVLPSAIAWMNANKTSVALQKKWTPEQEEAWVKYAPPAGISVSVKTDELICPIERVYPLPDSLAHHLEMTTV